MRTPPRHHRAEVTCTVTTLSINHLDPAEQDALYCHYSRQYGPQPAFIELDTQSGHMWAGYNPEIGNAVPMEVWHGLTRRYSLPVILSTDRANELMDEIAPLAQRVLDGTEEHWNGSNHVARMNEDAEDAEREIQALIEFNGESGQLCYIDDDLIDDWMAPVRTDIESAIIAGRTDAEIMAEYQGTGADEDSPIIYGLDEYIESVRSELVVEIEPATN